MATQSYDTQRLPLANVSNIRELGGYRGADGRRVRPHLLIRSGSLANLSPEDARTLAEDYRLRDIVDFRSPGEQARKPDVVPEGAELHLIPAIDDATYRNMTRTTATGVVRRSDDGFFDTVLEIALSTGSNELTGDFLEEGLARVAYRGLFHVLLENEGEGAVLWHCSQGKDRTGVASALVLAALGADVETIVHDYSLSADAYAALVERGRAYAENQGLDAETTEKLLGYAACGFPGVMTETLQGIIDACGSLEGYLKDAMGLDDDAIALLRETYLEPAC